jgi:hypothetical protein
MHCYSSEFTGIYNVGKLTKRKLQRFSGQPYSNLLYLYLYLYLYQRLHQTQICRMQADISSIAIWCSDAAAASRLFLHQRLPADIYIIPVHGPEFLSVPPNCSLPALEVRDATSRVFVATCTSASCITQPRLTLPRTTHFRFHDKVR